MTRNHRTSMKKFKATVDRFVILMQVMNSPGYATAADVVDKGLNGIPDWLQPHVDELARLASEFLYELYERNSPMMPHLSVPVEMYGNSRNIADQYIGLDDGTRFSTGQVYLGMATLMAARECGLPRDSHVARPPALS